MPDAIKRLAILDDYQGVAMSMGPWEKLPGVEVTVFRDTLTDRAALVQRLSPSTPSWRCASAPPSRAR